MDKYIGFDISSKDVSVCIIQKNQQERYATIGPDDAASSGGSHWRSD